MILVFFFGRCKEKEKRRNKATKQVKRQSVLVFLVIRGFVGVKKGCFHVGYAMSVCCWLEPTRRSVVNPTKRVEKAQVGFSVNRFTRLLKKS